MIDKSGYRLNVGIILANKDKKIFLGKRLGNKNAWQFPQGGMNPYETLEETMYRELNEEVGLSREDVKILAVTHHWLYYKLPPKMRRYFQTPLCIGQRQKWFLLQLISDDSKIKLDSTSPEFETWQWVNYWEPLETVIYFKRNIYQKVLTEFEPVLFNETA
jgi:putative (di)nucleoside polyphosphate hydrolase